MSPVIIKTPNSGSCMLDRKNSSQKEPIQDTCQNACGVWGTITLTGATVNWGAELDPCMVFMLQLWGWEMFLWCIGGFLRHQEAGQKRRLVIKETEEALSTPVDSDSCNVQKRWFPEGTWATRTGSPQLAARGGAGSRNTRLLLGQKNKDDVQSWTERVFLLPWPKSESDYLAKADFRNRSKRRNGIGNN